METEKLRQDMESEKQEVTRPLSRYCPMFFTGLFTLLSPYLNDSPVEKLWG